MTDHARTHRRPTVGELTRWGLAVAALATAVAAAFVREVGGVGLAPVAIVLGFAGVAASLQVLLHPVGRAEPRQAEPEPEAAPGPLALRPVPGET